MTCPHCTASFSVLPGVHVRNCARRSPFERAYYLLHRGWPEPSRAKAAQAPAPARDEKYCPPCGRYYPKPRGIGNADWAARRGCSVRCAGIRRRSAAPAETEHGATTTQEAAK